MLTCWVIACTGIAAGRTPNCAQKMKSQWDQKHSKISYEPKHFSDDLPVPGL